MNQNKNINKFRFIWSIIMAVIYLGISYILVFTPIFEDSIGQPIRIGMAVLFRPMEYLEDTGSLN